MQIILIIPTEFHILDLPYIRMSQQKSSPSTILIYYIAATSMTLYTVVIVHIARADKRLCV